MAVEPVELAHALPAPWVRGEDGRARARVGDATAVVFRAESHWILEVRVGAAAWRATRPARVDEQDACAAALRVAAYAPPAGAETFGGALKRARIADGKTVADVAAQLRITETAADCLELDLRAAPEPAQLRWLAVYLGADPAALEALAVATRPVHHLWLARYPDGREVRIAASINPLTGKARAGHGAGSVAHGYAERDAVALLAGDGEGVVLVETGEVLEGEALRALVEFRRPPPPGPPPCRAPRPVKRKGALATPAAPTSTLVEVDDEEAEPPPPKRNQQAACPGCAEAAEYVKSLTSAEKPDPWVRCSDCLQPVALTEKGRAAARKAGAYDDNARIPTGRHAAKDLIWYGRWVSYFEGHALDLNPGGGGRIPLPEDSASEMERASERHRERARDAERARARAINARLRELRQTEAGARHEACLRRVFVEGGGVFTTTRARYYEELGWALASPEQRVVWLGSRTKVRPGLPRRYARRCLREAVDAYDKLVRSEG